MGSERGVWALVPRIYDAAGNLESWGDLLEKLADAVHGASANLVVVDADRQNNNVEAGVRIGPERLREYKEYYSTVDYWAIRVKQTPFLQTGSVCTGEMICPAADLRRSEFYNDFLRRCDILHLLCGAVFRERSFAYILSFYRPWRSRPFGESQIRLLRALIPHLQRGIELHRRIAGLESLAGAASDTLDLLPSGLVLVDGGGKVVFVNRSARRILDQKDGLTLSREGLSAASPEETARLRKLLWGAQATTLGKGFGSPGGAMAISRPSLKRPLWVVVTPLPPDGLSLWHQRPAAAIFVSDPECDVEPNEEILGRVLGLTPAESKTAALLGSGKSLKEVSDRLQISRNTAKTHLQRIFQKTNSGRQGELIRLLHTIPRCNL